MADLRTRYLGLELRTPLVASSSPLTGTLDGLKRLRDAGAIELNIYYVSSSPGQSGSEVEWRYLDIVHAVRQAAGVPLAVKLSPYFSSVTNMAGQLVEAGANGLVLFNRFYQPDLDVETLEVVPSLELSTSAELRLPLRWIAILHGHRSLDQVRGRLSQRSVRDPAAFERANYLKVLASRAG
jgi:dihydroorotate dehydrogenase (fumarate)